MSKSDIKSTVSIVKIVFMAVLIFLSTYFLKIPLGAGYIHIGDSLIFLSVYLLGIRKGIIASATGAVLADIFGGYFLYFLPTLIIKSGMVLIMGVLSLKIFKNKQLRFIIGTVVGGIFQIISYTFVNYLINGKSGLFVSIVGDTIQTTIAIAVFIAIVYITQKLNIDKILKI